jgi:hypothetical protein
MPAAPSAVSLALRRMACALSLALALVWPSAGQAAEAAMPPVAPERQWREDSADAVRAGVGRLETSGDIAGAATLALRGADRFAGDDGLMREAVRLLLLSGQTRLAEAFLAARQAKQDSAEIRFLQGQTRERTGADGAALKAYLSAYQSGMRGPALDAALKRLAARAVRVEGLWLLPPPGWQRRADGLMQPAEALTLVVQAQSAADPKAVAMERIRAGLPSGVFTEAAPASGPPPDADPLAGGRLPPRPAAPELRVRPLSGGEVLAVAALQAGQVRIGLAVLALRRGQRVYTLSLSGDAPAEALETKLLALRDGVEWQASEVKP